MSVTISIRNNYDYSHAHNLMSKTRYDCQSCEHYGKLPDCRECGGNGYVEFENPPFEMNVANSNCRHLFNALNIPFDYCGTLPAETFRDAIRGFDAAWLERAGSDTGGVTSVRIIDVGISLERAQDYITNLTEIVNEAIRRGEPIVWC